MKRNLLTSVLLSDKILVRSFTLTYMLSVNERTGICQVYSLSNKKTYIMNTMNKQYRYQLESRRLTGRQLYLATCGSSGLNAEKAQCLEGRRVTIFPDSGCLEK